MDASARFGYAQPYVNSFRRGMARIPNNTNVFRIPRRFNWPLVIGGFAVLALGMMLGRWGASLDDSSAYLDMARWLRGELALPELQTPFSYRLGLPALAALVPGELHHVFATLNWLFVTATALLATATVRRLGFGTQRALAAGLLVILSLPTVWYAPGVLVDPASICMRMLFVFGVLTGRPGLALAAALAGTAVREEDILLLAWLASSGQVSRGRIGAALGAALVWIAALHGWLAPGDGEPAWAPDTANLAALLADWRGLLSLGACAGFVLPLALAGLRDAPERLQPLRGLLVLMVLPALYAALCAQADGRVVWDLYPFLLPFAVALGMPREAGQVPEVRQLRIARRA